MIYGEHEVSRHLLVFATSGSPDVVAPALMGVRLLGVDGVKLSRAEVERLRELCDEALS